MDPLKLVSEKYCAGTAVIVSEVPQENTVPLGFTVMLPEPVTLVLSVQLVPVTKVAVTDVLVLRTMFWGLVVPVRAPLKLPKLLPELGTAVTWTVVPHV